jgi:copper resistance protein B
MRYIIVLLLSFGFSLQAIASGMNDDPLIGKVMVSQFELRGGDGADPFVWEAQGWVGKDLNKFWFKTDGEVVDGETEDAEVQALYSRAIAPYWDAQIGWRRDIRPEPSRDWLAIGFQGLAPYWFEIDTAFFVGKDSRVGARLQGEYEILFTQKLILSPELEVNFYSKDDPEVGIGSGLADLEIGLRLRYEIRREFAPYIGVNWEKVYGNTADYRRLEGGDVSEFRVVAGVRAWF